MANVFIVRLLATVDSTDEIPRSRSRDIGRHLLHAACATSANGLRRLPTNLQEVSRGRLRDPRGDPSRSPGAAHDDENLPRLPVGLPRGGEKAASRRSATRQSPAEHTERETRAQQEVQSDREGSAEGENLTGGSFYNQLI